MTYATLRLGKPDQLYIDYHDKEWGVPETDGENCLK